MRIPEKLPGMATVCAEHGSRTILKTEQQIRNGGKQWVKTANSCSRSHCRYSCWSAGKSLSACPASNSRKRNRQPSRHNSKPSNRPHNRRPPPRPARGAPVPSTVPAPGAPSAQPLPPRRHTGNHDKPRSLGFGQPADRNRNTETERLDQSQRRPHRRSSAAELPGNRREGQPADHAVFTVGQPQSVLCRARVVGRTRHQPGGSDRRNRLVCAGWRQTDTRHARDADLRQRPGPRVQAHDLR